MEFAKLLQSGTNRPVKVSITWTMDYINVCLVEHILDINVSRRTDIRHKCVSSRTDIRHKCVSSRAVIRYVLALLSIFRYPVDYER